MATFQLDSGDRPDAPTSEHLLCAEGRRSRSATHDMNVKNNVHSEDAQSGASHLFMKISPDAAHRLGGLGVRRSGKRKVIGTPKLARTPDIVKPSGGKPLAACGWS
jgi:hypothetical protein